MMDEQRAFELSRLYVEERLAAAEKEYLLRSLGQQRAYLSGVTGWVGSVLVRVGRRLEVAGGAAHTGPSLEMRQRAV
jgi:hypothetical protein